MAKLGAHSSAKTLYLAGIPFAAAPFFAAVLIGFRNGSDLRLLWIAFAAFAGTAVIVSLAGARVTRAPAVALLAAGGFVGGIAVAALVAVQLSRRAPADLPFVPFGAAFALSFAVSHLFDRLSRPGAFGQQ